ncbi:MAG: dephospho-CoA kinase [Rhodocyclaceae bacterium]|nr:dephospho-CoA kinase [Rhodocyclaceae bacterium]MBU3988716.1 dephospho-CoA kinase [Gammaproteobacteria bacterium]MBU4005504.1 dephospho-CoA kinase [Gammaproteobacteria bacterium]
MSFKKLAGAPQEFLGPPGGGPSAARTSGGGFIVGLTGGIGSGKSEAANCFAALGAAVVDTDAIAHALTAAGGAAIEPIRAAFGSAVLTPDGALDRVAMRQRVFADPAERVRLESILHPLIRAASEEQIRCSSDKTASADFPYVVLVVPLLTESGGYRERVNRVLTVDCPEETQIARTMARSAMSRSEVEAIMAVQAKRQDRLAIADDVIVNDAGLDRLREQTALLHSRYLQLAQRDAE